MASFDGLKWLVETGEDLDMLRPREVALLAAFARLSADLPCKTFVDAGAHVGWWAVRAASRCERVIAFEPVPQHAEKLKRNAELNGLTNVTVVTAALGAARGTARIALRGMSSRIDAAGSLAVPVVPLDELADGVPGAGDRGADYLKVDVEGAEWDVVRGAAGFIKTRRPVILMEFHGSARSSARTREYLRGLGYAELFVTSRHSVFVHCSHYGVLGAETRRLLLALHWTQHVLNNIAAGRPWYYGLPYDWWWGQDVADFLLSIWGRVTRSEEREWELKVIGACSA
jgi:FkbM family methyltransferase